MALKKRGLGRGLDALLGAGVTEKAAEDTQPVIENQLQEIALDLIQPGKYQPRKDMDQAALEELAQSIRAQGIMQPIVLRSIGENRYEIIAGERRWRAAALAGQSHIQSIIREVPDEAAIAMALIENIQREDLNPIEEAIALQRLQQEYELTQQQVAEVVGKSRATVANLIRLLQLPDEVKTLLAHGDLEMGHARALLPLEQEQQLELAREVAAEGLTVRQAESKVRNLQQGQPKAAVKQQLDPDISRLEQKLAEKLGATVNIKHGKAGKGQLVIRYSSLQELQGVLEKMH